VRPTKLLRRLAEWAPAIIAAEPLERTRCILATRVGLEALEILGVEAEPLSVVTGIMNAAFLRWAEEGFPGGPDEGARRRVRILETEDRPLGLPFDGKGWRGHLVIRAGGLLVDLDAQQFERPDYAIHLPPGLLLEWGPYPDGRRLYRLPGGGVLRVTARPEDRSYQEAGDWRRGAPRLVQALVRAVEAGREGPRGRAQVLPPLADR
jgi:hypothetical protein